MKAKKLGDNAVGLVITGKRKNREPDHVRIMFPGGDVDVVRSENGDHPDYWVHIRINNPDHPSFSPGTQPAELVDARLDQTDKHVNESDVGDFGRKELYHMAIRVKPQWS